MSITKWVYPIITLILTILHCVLFPEVSLNWWFPETCFIVIWIALYSLSMGFLIVCSLFVSKDKEYNTKNRFYFMVYNFALDLILGVFNMKVKTTGFDLIPHDQKYLLVSNHLSRFDPMTASYLLRKDDLAQISKPSNFNAFCAGPVIKRNLYLPINRENPREAIKTINKAADLIQNGIVSMGLFPEGTRNKIDVNHVQEFKHGGFKVATKSQCPIVIVEFYNTNNVKKFHILPCKVEMNVLKVLYYEDYKDLHTMEISNYVHDLIQNKINERINEKEKQ